MPVGVRELLAGCLGRELGGPFAFPGYATWGTFAGLGNISMTIRGYSIEALRLLKEFKYWNALLGDLPPQLLPSFQQLGGGAADPLRLMTPWTLPVPGYRTRII